MSQFLSQKVGTAALETFAGGQRLLHAQDYDTIHIIVQ
jgi:hypothetical protein